MRMVAKICNVCDFMFCCILVVDYSLLLQMRGTMIVNVTDDFGVSSAIKNVVLVVD